MGLTSAKKREINLLIKTFSAVNGTDLQWNSTGYSNLASL